ncbi:SLAM family member 5 isoform X4 [Cyprinus carpio]|uniref:Ig-like domain-containing protein n=2 Tax=Cyprinus carpio TaxID=7962 RepID=A0A9J7XKK4_CYPCA|nr:SLAM family member 5 isoform X4 [Cyprinus carpio]
MYRNMETFVLFLVVLLVDGVLGVADEIQSVSVTQGDSVTLYTDVTETQKADLILWTFGSDSTRIAQINRMSNKISLYDDALDGRFRDRLKLDDQTGSLTITDITTQHAGLYRFLQIFDGKEVTPKKFSIIVSAFLPVPVISRNCSSSSSSCSLLCSVVNVGHVTLSWYKGNSLLSSISVSDLSISLSLPLEVEYQDKNTYSCVLNNPISNQTQHLDITQLCHTCSAPGLSAAHVALVCACALAVAAVLCGIYYYCQRKTPKQAAEGEGELIKLNKAAVPLLAMQPNETSTQKEDLQNSVFLKEGEVTLVHMSEGRSVKLHTDLTETQDTDIIWWKFVDSKEHNCAKFVIIARLNKTSDEEYLCNLEMFKDKLKLDHSTGSLTISSITPEHYGHYNLQIIRKGEMVVHTFSFIAHDLMRREQTQSLKHRRQTCP